MNVDEMMLSSLTVSRDKQHPKLGGCVGVFFQLFDWNRRLSSRKFFTQKQLLPAGKPPRIGSNKIRKFQEEYRKPKLLLISDGRDCKDPKEESFNADNYQERIKLIQDTVNGGGSFKIEINSIDNDEGKSKPTTTTTRRRNPGVVARLMGLETLPISCQIEKTEELAQDASSSRYVSSGVKSNHLTSLEEDAAFVQEIIPKCHDESECCGTACIAEDGYGDNDIYKSDEVGSNLGISAMIKERSRGLKSVRPAGHSSLTSDVSSANASTDCNGLSCLSTNSDGSASSTIGNHHLEQHSSSKHSKKPQLVSSYNRRNKISKSSGGNREIVSLKSSKMLNTNVTSKKTDVNQNNTYDKHIKLRFQYTDDDDNESVGSDGFGFGRRRQWDNFRRGSQLGIFDDGIQDNYYQRRKKVDHRAVERNSEFNKDQMRCFSDHESLIVRSGHGTESVLGSVSGRSQSKDSSGGRKRNKSRLSRQRSRSMDNDEIKKHLPELLNFDDNDDAECAKSKSSELVNCSNDQIHAGSHNGKCRSRKKAAASLSKSDYNNDDEYNLRETETLMKHDHDEDNDIKSDISSISGYGCLSESTAADKRVEAASRRRRRTEQSSSPMISSSSRKESSPGKEEVSLMKALMKRRAARLQQAAMEAEKQLSTVQNKIQENEEQTLGRREKLCTGRSELAGAKLRLLDLDQLLESSIKSVKLDSTETAALGSRSEVRQTGSSPSNNSVCSGMSMASSASGGVSCRTTAAILQELMSALGAAEPPAVETGVGGSRRRRRQWSRAISIDASDAADGDSCSTPPASICTAETESTSESVSCCGGTGQPSPVSVLVSPFDDDTSTPCEADAWRIRTEEDYVAAVLAATWDNQDTATRPQRSSPAWAFEALEERVATGAGTDLPTTRGGRRLVFDCVREALEEDKCRYPVGGGCTVVRLVHERIRGWRRPPTAEEGAPVFLEEIVAADLKRASNSWIGPFHTETAHIVSALERSLLRSLVHDVVSDLTL